MGISSEKILLIQIMMPIDDSFVNCFAKANNFGARSVKIKCNFMKTSIVEHNQKDRMQNCARCHSELTQEVSTFEVQRQLSFAQPFQI
jgi:ribosomal protein S2